MASEASENVTLNVSSIFIFSGDSERTESDCEGDYGVFYLS